MRQSLLGALTMKMNKTPLFCHREFTTGRRDPHLILFCAMQQNIATVKVYAQFRYRAEEEIINLVQSD